MRAVIIGNGQIVSYEYIKQYIKADDYIICADGGIYHAEKLGVSPKVVIGDFDSSEHDIIGANIKKLRYPARKDLTDGELCVKYALEHGFKSILFLAMTGDRLDHTMTNLLLLSQCERGMAVNEKNEIYYLKNELEIKNKIGKTLSIIPVRGDLKGITTLGLDYPLNDEDLFFGESRGNSNVITANICAIKVREGEGLVVIGNGE